MITSLKIPIKIILLIVLFFYFATCMAQVAPSKDKSNKAAPGNTESLKETKNDNIDTNDDNQSQSTGDKDGSVKQVKSERPDMSKSRGARPPNIVRPSGSRIPKGVGRPAGAFRHGRG
jgi:Ni/Co efflux regulator RcnB